MRHLISWLGLMGMCLTLSAQQAPSPDLIDSLQAKARDSQLSVSQRLSVYRQLDSIFLETATDRVFSTAREYYALADQANVSAHILRALYDLGTAHRDKGHLDSAKYFYEQRADYLKGHPDSVAEMNNLRFLGRLTIELGDAGLASEYLFSSLKLAEALQDSVAMGQAFLQLGYLYRNQREFERSVEYLNRSIEMLQQGQDDALKINAYNNIGIAYIFQGKNEEALPYLKEALALSERLHAPSLSNQLLNLGGVLAQMGRLDESLPYFQRAAELIQQKGDLNAEGSVLRNIGVIYEAKGQYRQAIYYAQQALEIALDGQDFPLAHISSLSLYNCYKRLGEYEKALEMYEQHVVIRDSINNEKSAKETVRQQMQYDFEKKTIQDSLDYVQQQAAAELAYQQQISQRNYALIGGLGLGAIVLFFLRYRQQLRNRQRELELEQERERQQRLKELDELKNRFFTNISHEFRTPLTVILGMASQLPAPQAQASSLIRRNGQRLLRLINQLLDLSRMEDNRITVNLVRGDIMSYLRYVAASFELLAQDRQITLTVETVPQTLEMDYDPEKIQEIVYNLLSNALKFTSAEGAVHMIAQVREETDPPQLHCQVQDDGPGISGDELPYIFDRFYQGSTVARDDSSGIGLALVKALLDHMGGGIEAQSELGTGSTFSWWLPVQQDPTTPLAAEEIEGREIPEQVESSVPTLPSIEDPNQPQLLIIEDNADVIAYLSAIFGNQYNLLTATDGLTGVALAQERVPDLVISDVMMPGQDGFAVTEALKTDARTSHIPVILLTAKATQADRLEGLAHGADAYLSKPFDQAELSLRVEKLLTLRQALQAHYRTHVPTGPALDEADSSPSDEPKLAPLDAQFLQTIHETVENNLTNPELSVHMLCEAVLLTRTQVYRKLKALTGQTPTSYIRTARLRQARHLLMTTTLTISEVAYDAGFNDPNYFSRAFAKEYGMRPSELDRSGS